MKRWQKLDRLALLVPLVLFLFLSIGKEGQLLWGIVLRERNFVVTIAALLLLALAAVLASLPIVLIWRAVSHAKPEGFCDGAWIAIHPYVFSLVHGTGNELFYYGNWIRKPGVAICSCNDGLRPVIFKVESAGQDSAMEYEPVR